MTLRPGPDEVAKTADQGPTPEPAHPGVSLPRVAGRTHLQVLTRAGAALATALDSIDPAMAELTGAIVPDMADWFALDLLTDGRLVRRGERRSEALTAVEGDPSCEGPDEATTVAGHVAASVTDSRPRVLRSLAEREPETEDERQWKRMGLDTVAVVPIRTRGLTLGAMTVGMRAGRGSFGDDHLELTTALSGRIAVTLERIEQHREIDRTAREAAVQAARLRRLMESAVVLGGARTENEVVVRLAAAARRVSGSTGAAVTIARGPGAPVTTIEGTLPEETVELALFDGNRQKVGVLQVGKPPTEAEDFELALVALAQIGGALIENRRLLDSLERSRAHLQALVDASPDAILEIDAESVILTSNSAAGEVVGRPLPGSLSSMLDDAGRRTLAEALAKAMFDEAPPRFEVGGWRGGEPVTLSIALAPLLKGDRAERIVALVSDVTEQRMLEQQLLRAQRMDAIGRLAGGIAHDFNNLITAIIGFSELAASSIDADHPAQDDLSEVVGAGRRAAELTAQLLSLGRRQAIERVPLDLDDLFAGMRSILERVLPAGIRLETTVAPGLLRARADRGQIEQVLLNLAINARDAMPDGGALTIGGLPGSNPSTVAITVSDTGAGMDPTTLERCFEPFFTTKDIGLGTGLGLAGVYGIVTHHEGTVAAQSTVGHGTTFTIELPATEEAVGQGADRPAGPLQGSETVLLVEDQSSVRALVKQVLQAYGYQVIVATDGDDALRTASEASHLDLLLTDVVMPGLTGADLAARLRPRFPDLRVLYISGYARGSMEHRGSIDDDIAFLAKPFDPVELGHKVRAILDGV